MHLRFQSSGGIGSSVQEVESRLHTFSSEILFLASRNKALSLGFSEDPLVLSKLYNSVLILTVLKEERSKGRDN